MRSDKFNAQNLYIIWLGDGIKKAREDYWLKFLLYNRRILQLYLARIFRAYLKRHFLRGERFRVFLYRSINKVRKATVKS